MTSSSFSDRTGWAVRSEGTGAFIDKHCARSLLNGIELSRLVMGFWGGPVVERDNHLRGFHADKHTLPSGFQYVSA